MEDTSGFYSNDNGELFYGPNYVLNAEFELRREDKDLYQYPVFGWYWFDSEDEAYTFFEIEKPVVEEPQFGVIPLGIVAPVIIPPNGIGV